MPGKKTESPTIVISRTDSIGDVMLTLPLAGVLRSHYPNAKLIFLGKSYTKAVIACCRHIDAFADWDELKKLPDLDREAAFRAFGADSILHVFPDKEIARLAVRAQIPIRVGTSHRFFHLFTCNRRITFSRRKSMLHEAQLNLKLLKGLGIEAEYALPELNQYAGFAPVHALSAEWSGLLAPDKFNLILHPRSRGSAREWGLENFEKLINLLPDSRFRIFVSGTREEGEGMREFLQGNPRIHDLTGKMSLDQLISFIAASSGLVAASTGPLHIASALGKKAIGIFAPMRPIHPGRWAPIGTQACFLVKNEECSDCRKSGNCHCIREITPEQVAEKLG